MAKLIKPIKIYGGKHYLAKKIIDLMVPHLTYLEGCFGGGSVLLEKDPTNVAEVANDKDYVLTNFWKVLQDEYMFADFIREVEAIPFSEVEFINADPCNQNPRPISNEGRVESAVAFFVRCRMSRAGAGKNFATLTKKRLRRGMSEQVSAWLTAVEGLSAIHSRLKRVLILDKDVKDAIKLVDDKETLVYLDPPYLAETRTSKDVYVVEFKDEKEAEYQKHEKLLKYINSGLQSNIILSGYRNSLYDEYLKDWRRVEWTIPNHFAGGDSKRIMTECCWMNY